MNWLLVHLDTLRESLARLARQPVASDRKSTRLNSSHQIISYAVFCLKKKKKEHQFVQNELLATPNKHSTNYRPTIRENPHLPKHPRVPDITASVPPAHTPARPLTLPP